MKVIGEEAAARTFSEVRLGKEFVADWCPHTYLKINESQGEDVKTGLVRFFDDDSEVEVLL